MQDSGALDRTHTFRHLRHDVERALGCMEEAVDGTFKASFKPSRGNPGALRFKVGFQHQAIDGPFVAPVTMILPHNTAVVRSDTISACRQVGTSLSCREK